MSNLSRRTVFRALPTIALMPIGPAVSATVEADPIFAAIAAQQVTWDAFGDTIDAADTVLARLDGRKVTAEAKAAHEAAGKADDDALTAIAATTPTTLAGVFAALKIVNDRGSDEQIRSMVATILASPLTGGAHG